MTEHDNNKRSVYHVIGKLKCTSTPKNVFVHSIPFASQKRSHLFGQRRGGGKAASRPPYSNSCSDARHAPRPRAAACALQPVRSRGLRAVDDEEAARAERDDVERRRFWLLKMPQLYAPKHRQRYVFLNLDNTAASMFMSRSLFRAIAGAQCPHDVRLNFEALTDRLCGSSSSAVVMHQLATFSKTSPAIARALEKFGWTLKPVGNDDQALQEELLKQLHKGAATANGKTLVLATGGEGSARAIRPRTRRSSPSSWSRGGTWRSTRGCAR